MKAPFSPICTQSLAGHPVRFFTAEAPYRMDGSSQPLVAWTDVLKAIGVPLVRRLAVSRIVAGEERYSIAVKNHEKGIKAVGAHVALAVIDVWTGLRRNSAPEPAIVADFIRISAEAAAIWARSIAVEDFAATVIDQATAQPLIEKTAEGARHVTAQALGMLAASVLAAGPCSSAGS